MTRYPDRYYGCLAGKKLCWRYTLNHASCSKADAHYSFVGNEFAQPKADLR